MGVAGGFIVERRPGERGLVHLIEHLAFKGSAHFAPGSFQRIGLPLTFPAPSAASTDWHNSSYYLVARSGEAKDLDTLLMLFRDVASDLSFPTEGLAEARTEVVEEMAEKQVGNRIFASYIAAVAPGSPNDVLQAQNSDDVPIANIDTIRALYRRVYRPEHTVVTIVGRVDSTLAEKLIERRFDSWRGVGLAHPIVEPSFERSSIKPVSYSADPMGRSVATIGLTMNLPPRGGAREQRIRSALMDLTWMQAAAGQYRQWWPTSPPGKVGMTIENAEGYRLIRFWQFLDADDDWRTVAASVRDAVCGINATGWSEQGWEAAKMATLGALRQQVQQGASRKNIEIAAELADAKADVGGMLMPAALLQYAETWLPTVTAAAANAQWQRQWRAGVEHARVETPELAKVASPADDVSRAISDKSARTGDCRRS